MIAKNNGPCACRHQRQRGPRKRGGKRTDVAQGFLPRSLVPDGTFVVNSGVEELVGGFARLGGEGWVGRLVWGGLGGERLVLGVGLLLVLVLI